MTISLRLSDTDAAMIRKYADFSGISVSELIRQSVMSRIENEADMELYKKAYAAYQADPVTYSLDEVEQELGLK